MGALASIEAVNITLEQLCLIAIIMSLEQYPVECLSLLPARLRFKILQILPIADVCKLEKTAFASGVEMERVWQHHFQKHTARYYVESFLRKSDKINLKALERVCTSSKELYLCTISNIILNDLRPSGLWRVEGGGAIFRETVGITDSNNICIPNDIVHYLIASCNEDLFPMKEPLLDHKTVTIQDLTWKEGSVSLTCQPLACNQRSDNPNPWKSKYSADYFVLLLLRYCFVERYKGYLRPGNLRIKDTTAIEVMMKECGYLPVVVNIDARSFLRKWGEDSLTNTVFTVFFQGVLSLTIDCQNYTLTVEEYQFALAVVLSCKDPPLCSLTLPYADYLNEGRHRLVDTTVFSLISALRNLNSLRLYVQTGQHAFLSSELFYQLKYFLNRPHFQTLMLKQFVFSQEQAIELVMTFLSADCKVKQTLSLEGEIFNKLASSASTQFHRYKTPKYSIKKKQLILNFKPSSFDGKWLFDLPVIRLHCLKIVNFSEEMLKAMNDHSNFQVRHLILGSLLAQTPCLPSTSDVVQLLENRSLRNLEIMGYNDTITALTEALKKTVKLKSLSLYNHSFLSDSTPELLSVFCDVIFSMHKMENFSLKLFTAVDDLLVLVKVVFESWQRVTGGRNRLKYLTFVTPSWNPSKPNQSENCTEMLTRMKATIVNTY